MTAISASRRVRIHNIRNKSWHVYPELKFMIVPLTHKTEEIVDFEQMPEQELQSVLSTIDDYDAGRGLLTE